SFFLYVTPTTSIYTLSLHDALPISLAALEGAAARGEGSAEFLGDRLIVGKEKVVAEVIHAAAEVTLEPGAGIEAFRREHGAVARSEEHTSELQSQSNLVCRLLLEKK